MPEFIPLKNQRVTLIKGDCLEVLPLLESNSIDSVVTDPPYHLTSGNLAVDCEAFGSKWRNKGQTNKSGRKSGIVGQKWDGGDIAFDLATWRLVYDVLRPGGYMLTFGATRTWHRLACAIEDAGFVIQDTIMWLYAQGYPKGRMHLKPAWEPIILAYRPPGGARMLQVDECRVPTDSEGRAARRRGMPPKGLSKSNMFRMFRPEPWQPPDGRWPANVCHDGSDEVMQAFDAFGEKTSRAGIRNNHNQGHESWSSGSFRTGPLYRGHSDSGSPARFFKSCSPDEDYIQSASNRFMYSAKANKFDRIGSKHPTIKPINLMKWLVPLVTPKDGVTLDPFAGSGTTGKAAIETDRNAILIEREEEYCNDIKRRIDEIFIPKDDTADKPDYNLGGLFAAE
jgi:site-specific DNA-methyltransferase (adenine-specific)